MRQYREYREIKVSDQGWVSSTSHYHVTVWLAEGKRRRVRVFLINAQAFLKENGLGYLERPRYVVDEVLRQLREKIEGRKFRWFETNRQGIRRYSNFRYFDEKELTDMMARWPGAAAEGGNVDG